MNSSLSSNQLSVAVTETATETASLALLAAKAQIPPEPLDIQQIKKALVLIPHPDDESIGCGGLLALLAEQNIPAHLILVSDGSGAGGLPEGAAQRRQQELDQAIKQLGDGLTWECWQLADGSLSQEPSLKEKIQASITRYQPSVIIAPWLQDMHPDHAATGHRALSVYRDTVYNEADDKASTHKESVLSQGILFYEVWTPLPATHILNISTVWHKKMAALQQHKTALSCGHYLRATEALAAYRSLLSGHLAAEGEYAEAYYHLQLVGQKTEQTLDSSPSAFLDKAKATTATAPTKKYQVRYACKQDAAELRNLFINVFEHTPETDWWLKKYGHEPQAGTVAVDQNQAVIAYYGALARQGHWHGSTLNAAQQADVMVARPYRFATKKNGVFAAVSRLFLQEQLGSQRAYQMAYGFPTARALTLGIRLGLYQEGDDLAYWEHRSPPNRMGLGWQVTTTSCRKQKAWQWVNALKPFMADADNVFWLKKTGAYWQQRFRQHPKKDYRILRLYRWGRLSGVAIIQHQFDSAATPRVEIMDLALAGNHPDSAQKLIAAIINHSYKQGAECTTAWGTRLAIDELQRHAQSLHHSGESSVVDQGRMALPADTLDAPLTPQIKNHCWMLGADTDFR
ncbi:PIG-L family deacetylase [Oceanospirillum maris]|uniref:PIG-L family deacetylase n=1 Tax=Oceanospirillum maris TaxID=64977 RepID=UPI0004230BC5|nr:PIG-L family deacetylase [Oceanospirillum maris]